MMKFWKRLVLTLEMIKFEHSVFALPFALTGALLAFRESHLPGRIFAGKLLWIVIAMVAARSAAMAFNRILDADIDARNPRTRARHIPAGLLSPRFAWAFTGAAVLVFLLAARALNPLCLKLAPIAVSGSLDWRILWLTAAVTFWTAGFDIIYSCQDYEFDQTEGLFSLPRRFGISGALWIARIFHVTMIGCLAALAFSFELGWLSLTGIGAVILLLLYEHSMVKADDLSRVNAAFFTVNGYVSVLFILFWAADIYFLGMRA